MSRNTYFTLGLIGLLAACSDPDSPTDPIDASPPDAPEETGLVWTQSFDAADTGWLLNVWGPASDDLYAVGGTFEEGRIMHFDGQGWSSLDLGVEVPLLNWAHGFGADDITVVGAEGTAIHWDGEVWTVQETPTEQNLWGVWGAAPDDLWAVGGEGRQAGQETVLHYDGETWTEAEIPELQRANVYAFFKVWGTGADNVYVVGQRGVVLHYDGETWTEELAGASADLISLWGTGPDRIVAVGGRANGVMTVWDGTEWTAISLGSLPGLNGVWMAADGTAYGVGISGLIVTLDVDTMTYEEDYVSLPLLNGQADFHAVYSADGTTLVGVGGNLTVVDPPFQGLAFQATIPTEEE